MNLRAILISVLAALFAIPVLACGPMPSSGGTSNMSPGREKWTRKRVNELKRERQAQRQNGNGPDAGTKFISKMQQLNNPLAVTAADEHRAAVKRRNLINAIEFLSLKKERGELGPEGQAKLNALINYYRTNYMSGY
jgi:hypothetical protein